MAALRSVAVLLSAASILIVVAAAAANAAPAPATAPAPPKAPPPSAAELLHNDPAYIAREHRLEAMFGNARDRDPTGQVAREHAQALAERRACADKACLDSWFRRREAALKQYVEN